MGSLLTYLATTTHDHIMLWYAALTFAYKSKRPKSGGCEFLRSTSYVKVQALVNTGGILSSR